MSEDPRKIKIPSAGFWPELLLRIKLIMRLMSDPRVSPLLKVLPVGALIYWFVPTDLMPFLPFDDAAVLWLASTFFVEMCPQPVVQEHMERLRLESQAGSVPPTDTQPGDVVDAEYRDLGGQNRR